MKRVITGSCLAAAFAVGLAAQTPSPTNPPQTTPQTPPSSSHPSASQDKESKDSKSVTVTGCLKAGDSADSYQLSDLKWGGKGSSTGSTVGTSGSTSAPAGLASASMLKVTASGSTKLSEHVGHQVEITGTIGDKEKSSAPSTSPTDPAAPSASRPSASASASTPSIEAKSVRMVSQTCSM